MGSTKISRKKRKEARQRGKPLEPPAKKTKPPAPAQKAEKCKKEDTCGKKAVHNPRYGETGDFKPGMAFYAKKRMIEKDIRFLENIYRSLEDDALAENGWNEAHAPKTEEPATKTARKNKRLTLPRIPRWIQSLCRLSDNLSFHFIKWAFTYPWEW